MDIKTRLDRLTAAKAEHFKAHFRDGRVYTVSPGAAIQLLHDHGSEIERFDGGGSGSGELLSLLNALL